ncbi:hypothetical protein [Cellulomonas iranensis]|uniref:hypothetical protein n=1 Tax=Cellulomonas iranensis TaxID=76862 RepID=UPI0013D141B0|nr:hypothetical protein [Cellulomonas iranensis]
MTRSQLQLVALDAVLGPTAAAHRTDGARPTALALLTRGLGSTPAVPAARVIAWAVSRLRRTRPDVVELLTGPSRHHLVAAATSRVELSQSDDGRRELAIRHARRLVGRLLTPAGSGVRVVGARAALVVVGLQVIANLSSDGSGIDAPRIDPGRIGVALGATPATARGWLRLADEERWLRRAVGSVGHVPTLKMTQLRGAAVATADAHQDLIAALVAGNVDHPGAAAVRSVCSPVWGYGPLSRSTWLVLVADACGVDPTTLGVTARTARAARADLARRGVVAGPDLADRLDRIARTADGPDATAPADRAATAEAARRRATAQRVGDIAAARTERVELRTGSRTVIGRRVVEERTVPPVRDAIQERATLPLPRGFDPDRADHMSVVHAKVRASGWTVDRVDVDAGVAHLVRTQAA